MHPRYASSFTVFVFVFLAASTVQAQLAFALIDRKFPSGQFCPVETRDGSLVTFTAPLNGTVRITFTAENQFPDFEDNLSYNDPHIDNVLVMTLDQWNLNQNECSSDCFAFNFSNNEPGTPAYPTDATSLSQIAFAQLFDGDPNLSQPGVWSGGSFASSFSAASDDASGTDCSTNGLFDGGSLALGSNGLGNVDVSASAIVGGLTPGETYVAFCWFYLAVTNDEAPATLSILVEETNVVGTRESSFGALKASFD